MFFTEGKLHPEFKIPTWNVVGLQVWPRRGVQARPASGWLAPCICLVGLVHREPAFGVERIEATAEPTQPIAGVVTSDSGEGLVLLVSHRLARSRTQRGAIPTAPPHRFSLAHTPPQSRSAALKDCSSLHRLQSRFRGAGCCLQLEDLMPGSSRPG